VRDESVNAADGGAQTEYPPSTPLLVLNEASGAQGMMMMTWSEGEQGKLCPAGRPAVTANNQSEHRYAQFVLLFNAWIQLPV